MCFRAPFMDGVAFHDPMHEATKKPLTTVAACHCSPYSPGRQSRPHLFHVVRKVCTKSGHVSTIPPVVKNNSHHGISTIKSDYPLFFSHSTSKLKGFVLLSLLYWLAVRADRNINDLWLLRLCRLLRFVVLRHGVVNSIARHRTRRRADSRTHDARPEPAAA